MLPKLFFYEPANLLTNNVLQSRAYAKLVLNLLATCPAAHLPCFVVYTNTYMRLTHSVHCCSTLPTKIAQ